MPPSSTSALPRFGARAKLALKLLIGAGVVAFVASKIDWQDQVQIEGETEVRRGQGLHVDPQVAGVWIQPAGGTRQEVPFHQGPVLLEVPEGFRVELPSQPPILGSSAGFQGALELEAANGKFTTDLSTLARVRRDRGDGTFELTPNFSEGLRTVFGRVSALHFGLALLLFLVAYLFGIRRWQILLLAQGLGVSFFEAVRLTFVGLFFNNVVPGLTGGDLIKAVLVAKAHPGRGAVAVGTVIVDRVLGLAILALLSAGVLAFHYSRYQSLAQWLFLALGAGAAMVLVFFSRRVRRALRVDGLMRRLPGAKILKSLDEAFLAYRSQGATLAMASVLSVLAHAANIVAIYILGRDIGVGPESGLEGTPLITYLATVPIILIVSSLPLLPGGWGVGEAAFAYFFRTVGILNPSLSIGLSILTRTTMLAISLFGGVFLVLDRRPGRAHPPAQATPVSEPASCPSSSSAP